MMVLEVSGDSISWEALDARLEAIPGLASWTISAASVLAERIPGTKLYSHIDYRRFAGLGEAYLAEYWTPAYSQGMRKRATPGFAREQRHARRLVEAGGFQHHAISESELSAMLASNYVIGVVDIRQLEGETGQSCHAVVVYEKAAGLFYFHDPGLPAAESVAAPSNAFRCAMGTAAEVIVVPAQ
jgi:hypothetical protein